MPLDGDARLTSASKATSNGGVPQPVDEGNLGWCYVQVISSLQIGGSLRRDLLLRGHSLFTVCVDLLENVVLPCR